MVTTLVDVTGLVRIDASGHIFVEDPDLAARLDAIYSNITETDCECQGVPVSWTASAPVPESGSETYALAVKPPTVNSLCNCRKV